MLVPDLISNALALFLAWLFTTAAIHKWRAPDAYIEPMSVYLPGFSPGKSGVLFVAVLELVLALMILLPWCRDFGLAAAALLLAAYAAFMARQISQGRVDLKCGCAGSASRVMISPGLILRNMVCIALALFALIPSDAVAPGFSALGLTLCVVLFMIIVYLCSEQLIDNAQQLAGEH